MEKEENPNKENTTAETSDETVGAKQQSENKQEDNKGVEEEKELSPSLLQRVEEETQPKSLLGKEE